MARPTVKYTITADDKSKKTVEGIEKRLKSAAKVGMAALATGSVAAAAGIATLSIKAAQAADNVGKLSLQLGISVKHLSELEFVAGQTGVKFETLSMAMQRSTRRIAEAAQGTGEAQTALKELGISAQALNQLDPAAQFEVLAKQLNEVTNEADQVRLAFKLFDSEGVRLLRTIKQTGGNFDELSDKARSLGSVLDGDLAQKGADVVDSMSEIKAAMSGVGNSLLATFGPAIVTAANYLVEFINNARKAAVAVGLLEVRLSQLKIDELNQHWLENNRLIVENEKIVKRSRSSAGKNSAKEKILDLEKQNEAIKKQIALIGVQATEEERINEAKKATLVEGGDTGKSQEASAAEFQRFLDSLLSEEQALVESYARRLQLIEENTKAGSDIQKSLQQQEYARFETALTKHQAKIGKVEAKGAIARKNFEQKTAKQKTAFVVNELANMTAGVAQHSRTMFKINKIAGIANAVINTARGVTMALASYPPPISFAMAAAQAAAGYVQIQAIKNTQFGGGGGGTTPSVAGSAPTINSIPVETAPVIEELSTTQDSIINISFNPGITDSEAVRTFITEDLSEALRDGAGLDVRVIAQ